MTLENNQQILVLTDFTNKCKIALKHAIILAEMLEKGITLACFNESLEDELKLFEKLKTFADSKDINTVVLSGKPAKAIELIIPDINAVLAIVSFEYDIKTDIFYPGKLLKIFRKSRIPYMFVNKDITDSLFYKKIILPIDSTKESKEKVLWASYFSRFNDAEVKVMTAHVKDENYVRQLNNNQKFIRKMFDNFDVNFEIVRTMEKERNIDMHAIETANDENAGLVIVLATKSYDLIDMFKGPKELFSILNPWKIPVMCLNPRDDLYVLCD